MLLRSIAREMYWMEDIAQYCTIRSMDRSDALDALKRGEVTAVLELPEDFIGN